MNGMPRDTGTGEIICQIMADISDIRHDLKEMRRQVAESRRMPLRDLVLYIVAAEVLGWI